MLISGRSSKHKILSLILILLFGESCTPKSAPVNLNKYSESRPLLGTIVKVDICYREPQKEKIEVAFQKVWERIEDIHWRMSVFDEKSDVMRVNNSYPQAVTVGEDTDQLIRDSLFYSKVTLGVFDITVYPLIKLWKDGEQKKMIPSPAEIQAVKKVLGGKNIELLPNHRVRLLNQGTKIDLNSIAEEYAADEAGRILKEHGFNDFLVDAGGDLMAGGFNCEGTSWRIGIRDPQNPSQFIDVVEVSDMAVTTSGHYEHYYEINGQKWSHIINPISGYPQMEVASATVIAPTAKVSDVLSTVLCILSPEKGTSLIDSLGEGYASIVLTPGLDGQLLKYTSRDYKRYKSNRDP